MSRLLTLGAEYNAGATADMDYDSTSGSTISYDTVTPRSGVYCYKFVCAASGPFLTRQYTPTANANDGYFRAYINVTSITTASSISIFTGRSAASGNVINIRLTRTSASTYTLALWDEQTSTQIGSASGSLNTNTYYRLEMSYLRTAGTFSALVDGSQFASGTGSTLKDINTIRWGSIDASTMTILFDDLAVNDNTGTSQTGLPGSGKVIRLKPNAAGDVNTFATQTGGTAGAGNNFTRVNEVAVDDATTLNGSSTLNQEDLFNMDNSGIGASDTVNVVEIWGRYRNSTADPTAALRFEVEKAGSGTKAQSASLIPNATTFRMNVAAVPKTPPIVLYKDPDGTLAWTQATLDTMQVGYKLQVAPGTAGRRIDVTSVSAIVDYTPAAGTPWSQPLSDSVTPSESLVKAVVKNLADSDSTSDANAKNIVISKSDSVTVSDLASKIVAYIRSFADSVTSSDAIVKSSTLNRADSVTATDSQSKVSAFSRTFADTVTTTEAMVKAVGKKLADSVTPAEVRVMNFVKKLADSVTSSDVFSKTMAYTKSLADSVTSSDSNSKAVGKHIADSVTATDVFAGFKGFQLNLNDSVSAADVTSKAVGKNLADSVTPSDSINKTKSIHLSFSDTVVVTDNFSFTILVVVKPVAAPIDINLQHKQSDVTLPNTQSDVILKPDSNDIALYPNPDLELTLESDNINIDMDDTKNG